MENHKNSRNKRQGQDTKFKAQLVKVLEAFKVKPSTMLEVAKRTDIMRSNVCWHVESLKEQNHIAFIQKRKCSITGYPYVNEYTGNPDLFPTKSNQLNLFEL